MWMGVFWILLKRIISKFPGFTGGSWWDHTGAAAEYVCLPRDPDLTTKFSSGYAYIYGSEYDATDFGFANDLPCSVCRSTVQSSVLIFLLHVRWLEHAVSRGPRRW